MPVSPVLRTCLPPCFPLLSVSAASIPHLPFTGHTLPSERRDFVEWRRGRTHYVVWALDLDGPAVRERMVAAQACLGGWLLDGYRRQPHVTLALCGFPAATPAGDEFGAAALRAQCQRLAALGLAPFELRIGGLASFQSAPYLTVDDDVGAVAALRAALNGGDVPDGRYAPHVPHVTVGLYAGPWPADDLRARLAGFEAGPPLALRVRQVRLMAYEAADIGGPLQTLGAFDLAHAGAGRAGVAWTGDAARVLGWPELRA